MTEEDRFDNLSIIVKKAEVLYRLFLSSIGAYAPLRLCGGRTLSVSLWLPPLPIQWESLPRSGKALVNKAGYLTNMLSKNVVPSSYIEIYSIRYCMFL